MHEEKPYHWLQQGEHRQRVIISLKQPMTAKQLAKKTSLSLDSCSAALEDLFLNELVTCLNPAQRRSRLYWITDKGRSCQQELRKEHYLSDLNYDFPEVDWESYGWVCYSHRSAIIKALVRPMQPSAIKRKARFNEPLLRMSANNVRDVIKLFLQRGIVKKLRMERKIHPCYELTDLGLKLRRLLLSAESLS